MPNIWRTFALHYVFIFRWMWSHLPSSWCTTSLKEWWVFSSLEETLRRRKLETKRISYEWSPQVWTVFKLSNSLLTFFPLCAALKCWNAYLSAWLSILVLPLLSFGNISFLPAVPNATMIAQGWLLKAQLIDIEQKYSWYRVFLICAQ